MFQAEHDNPTSAPPISLGVLDYATAQQAAVHGLMDLFGAAARLHQKRSGAVGLTVRRWQHDALTEPERPLTALILPPSLHDGPPSGRDKKQSAWLMRRYHDGTILCSVCVGAFLLAELGLLDGRPATTHWALRETFAARFPKVRLNTDRLIVDDGDIITAGGIMAWMDLGLNLIGRFLGPSTMLTTARYFLVDPGGREQRFYRTFSPAFSHGDDAIIKVQRWLPSMIGQRISVAMMATQAGLGRRTFLRRFGRATGLKTTEYLQHLCIGRARELLELTNKSQQQIAWDVGYEDPGALRRVFVKLLGLSPGEYRRRFGCSPGGLVTRGGAAESHWPFAVRECDSP